MTVTPARSVEIDGLFNMRDLGGFRAGDQTTKWQTLYRSDALDRVTQQGREQFAALGIATIVDLRDDSERQLALTALPGVTIVPSPILQGINDSIRDPGITIEAFYAWLVREHGTNYVNALRQVTNALNTPVLVHCTAGKDRTGTLVAMALLSIGVDRDDVLHDYSQSEHHLAGEWADRHRANFLQAGYTLTPNLERLLARSPAETLDETLTLLETEHGSVPEYLRAHGMREPDFQHLAASLLD